MDKILLAKGAEAELYLEDWLGIKTVLKCRICKKYRNPELDYKIRRRRTLCEVRNMLKARKLGINVPHVLELDLSRLCIRLEYIEGINLRDLTRELDDKLLEDLYSEVGKIVGKLHLNGIMHGDLALTNFIYSRGRLYVIDFGLSYDFQQVFDKKCINLCARDINVLLRNLEANFGDRGLRLFQHFLNSYSEVLGFEIAKNVVKEVKRIRSMARYAVRV